MESYGDFATACRLLLAEVEQRRNRRQPSNGDLGGSPGGDVHSDWTWMDHPRSTRHGWLQKHARRRIRAEDPAASDSSINSTKPSSNLSPHPAQRRAEPATGLLAHTGQLPEPLSAAEATVAGQLAMLEEDDDTVDDITESTSSPSIPSATVDKMVDVSTVVELHLHMVFSATYRVPHLMFQAFDPTGTPLDLSELRSSKILGLPPDPHERQNDTSRDDVVDDNADTPFAFASILQDAHPSTGEMMWSLHPCEMRAFVEEMLRDEDESESGLGREGIAGGGGDTGMEENDGAGRCGGPPPAGGNAAGSATASKARSQTLLRAHSLHSPQSPLSPEHHLRYLKACVTVCGTAVDMR